MRTKSRATVATIEPDINLPDSISSDMTCFLFLSDFSTTGPLLTGYSCPTPKKRFLNMRNRLVNDYRLEGGSFFSSSITNRLSS